ncbi:MAG: hypothetical protein GY812_05990 [Actinomycetia bacterium]|nr:hypothetical protein [Actinomycetes bacterium]
MLITCWSVKGGAGVSVVSAALGGLMAQRHGRAVVVDLGGDQPAALGMSEPAGPGILDWCDSAAPGEALARLAVDVTSDLLLVPKGEGSAQVGADRGAALVQACTALGEVVVVDAGTPLLSTHDLAVSEPGLDGHGRTRHPAVHLREAGSSLFVTTGCYMALRRAMSLGVTADGVVFVREPGRSVGRRDIADILGLPVVGVVESDPAVRRAIDSGSLARRVPPTLATGLRRAH